MNTSRAGSVDQGHRVGILVYDGVTMIDVAGPTDVFTHANARGGRYEVALVSPDGADVTTSTGTTLTVNAPAVEAGTLGTVLIPGGHSMIDEPIDPALIAATRRLASRAGRVTSVCTGSFLLAEAGLLDGRRATTHWRRTTTFARRYPYVDVQPDALSVRDGNIVTAAGASCGIDLALTLVEDDLGALLAGKVAQDMVVFMQRPDGQSRFSAPSRRHIGRRHPLRRLLDSIAADPSRTHTPISMARIAAMSPRQLTRLFHDEIGTTPARYVELVRLENAQALLLAGHSVASAAAQSGFGSGAALRRVFAHRLGTLPTEHRARELV